MTTKWVHCYCHSSTLMALEKEIELRGTLGYQLVTIIKDDVTGLYFAFMKQEDK